MRRLVVAGLAVGLAAPSAGFETVAARPPQAASALVEEGRGPFSKPAHRSAGAVHTVGGCQVFPADNWWNTRIDKRPVYKHSKAIVSRQAAGHGIHLDLGVSEEYYGIPVNVASVDQPSLPLQFGVEGEDYGDESDRGPVPIPPVARIEGWRSGAVDPHDGDRHVITVQQGTCRLVELYKAERVYGGDGEVVAWRASAAARWDLGSNKLRPKYWTSADAAGLPILPGLLSYDEAASGRITHALRFTLPSARAAFTKPARHCGPSSNTSSSLPPYGMRFRLKKGTDISAYTGAARAIAVAMKRYGLMYADQGSAMYVTGSADPRWADALDQFDSHPLDGSRFEVVKPTSRITRCR